MDSDIRRDYGWAEIDPDGPVVAGSTGTWRITYHAGRYGVDDGGVIKIAWRDVSDWEAPQFTDPEAPAYASVATTGPVSLRAAFEKQRYVRPWRLCVTIDVFDDSLSEGDTVTLTLGDRSQGSPGSRAQTFCKEAFEFRVAVDWCGTWVYTEVPSPSVEIKSGPADRLVTVCPSHTTPGEGTWVGVKAEDLWGNPSRTYEGTVRIDAGDLEGLPDEHRFGVGDEGVKRFEGVKAPRDGVYRVRVEDLENGLTAEGNPLRCVEAAGRYRPFWGDLHGQSEETVGTNPVSSYFRFARDSALIDFAGHQGNDFQITREVWEEIKRQANSQNAPGAFVAFVGYEWSGNTPLGGDRNVYYLADDGPLYRSSHVLVPDKSDTGGDCTHVTDLHNALKGEEALVVPHVGGRYANLAWRDPVLEPVIEVYSEWGEFEWFLRDALAKGYRVGFTAGSDDHKGRPGAGPSRQWIFRSLRRVDVRFRGDADEGGDLGGPEGATMLRDVGPAYPPGGDCGRKSDGVGIPGHCPAGDLGAGSGYGADRTGRSFPGAGQDLQFSRAGRTRPEPGEDRVVGTADSGAESTGEMGRFRLTRSRTDRRCGRVCLRHAC